jgi:hypothetical protein
VPVFRKKEVFSNPEAQMDTVVQETPAVETPAPVTESKKRKRVTKKKEKKDIVHGYEDLDVFTLRKKLAEYIKYPGYNKWSRNPLVIMLKFHEKLEKKRQQKMDLAA